MYSRHLDSMANAPTVSPPGPRQHVQTTTQSAHAHEEPGAAQPLPPSSEAGRLGLAIHQLESNPDKREGLARWQLFSILFVGLILGGLLTWGGISYGPRLFESKADVAHTPGGKPKEPVVTTSPTSPPPAEMPQVQLAEEQLNLAKQAQSEANKHLSEADGMLQSARTKLASMKMANRSQIRQAMAQEVVQLATKAQENADMAKVEAEKIKQAADSLGNLAGSNSEKALALKQTAETYVTQATQSLETAEKLIQEANSSISAKPTSKPAPVRKADTPGISAGQALPSPAAPVGNVTNTPAPQPVVPGTTGITTSPHSSNSGSGH